MRRREREINIFNIAFLDVITGALGVFVLLVIILAPHYTGNSGSTLRLAKLQKAMEEVRAVLERALGGAAQPDEIERLRAALPQAMTALQAADAQLTALKIQLDQLMSQLSRTAAENTRLRQQVAGMQQQIDAARVQLAGLTQRLSQASAENQALRGETEELRQEIARRQQEIDAARSEISGLSQQLAQAGVENQTLQATVEQLRQEIGRKQDEAEAARREVASLNQRLSQATAENSTLRTDNLGLRQELAQRRQELDAARRDAAGGAQAKAENQELRDELAALRRREEAVRAENVRLTSENERLRRQSQKLAPMAVLTWSNCPHGQVTSALWAAGTGEKSGKPQPDYDPAQLMNVFWNGSFKFSAAQASAGAPSVPPELARARAVAARALSGAPAELWSFEDMQRHGTFRLYYTLQPPYTLLRPCATSSVVAGPGFAFTLPPRALSAQAPWAFAAVLKVNDKGEMEAEFLRRPSNSRC